MKKILLSVVIATTLALTSCQFDDSALWSKLDEYGKSIRDHEQRISALEELCKQMNTNIEALQTLVDALEKRDYVTNVSEVRSNGEVIGYTISFGKSDTITIYHGQDGKDGANGADGKDGYTPQIGVMKDTDGIYYWTLDGEWLLDGKGNKIKAVGTDGADGKDGQDGTNGSDGKDGQDGINGTDGKDGADGKDGITPQLKIENDYWYVSYDNGATWVQLGKATGEDGKDGQDGNDGADGSDGADGEDGDSIFKSVTQDDEYVYFNLADGTMITLPKHDKENIQFEDLQVKAICCKNWDTNNDGELSYAEAAAVADIGDVFSEDTNIIAFTELKYFTGITKLSAKAFSKCTNLWKITIPENVISIESGANDRTTSSGTTEGYGAFYKTAITNIILPNALPYIGDYSFRSCKSLKSVSIPASVTTIGNSAFSGCSGLTSVIIPDSVTTIGDDAFRSCSDLTSITIPDSVTSIGSSAFYGCSGLTYLIIGKGVTTIGSFAFADCTGELIIKGKFLEKDFDFDANYWLNWSKFTKLSIGDNITKIGKYAIKDQDTIISVTILDSVTEIGYMAFWGCNNLISIYLTSITPPEVDANSFFAGHVDMKIYVPHTSVSAYKTAWSSQTDRIVGYDFEE